MNTLLPENLLIYCWSPTLYNGRTGATRHVTHIQAPTVTTWPHRLALVDSYLREFPAAADRGVAERARAASEILWQPRASAPWSVEAFYPAETDGGGGGGGGEPVSGQALSHADRYEPNTRVAELSA